jgi:hypothetical protein
MVSFLPQPLYLWGKSPQYSLDRGWVGTRADLDVVAKKEKDPIIAPAGN